MQTSIASSQSPGRTGDPRLHRLSEVIEHAAHLLPAQGPITVFIHHNTLHAFEDLPFHEAVKKGAQVFGCQPYLSEDRYREELRRGRIRFAELQEVLEQDLGERAGEPIPCFGTRLDLRLAMLQYPLRTGPTEELVWYVAEANALRRVRRGGLVGGPRAADRRDAALGDARPPRRERAGRQRRGARRPASRGPPDGLAELLDRFGESTIENWSDDDWEGFTLQALWRVCCDGVRDLPPFTPPPPPPVRHRDLLLEATGVGRRRAGPRPADPVLRGVPRPGPGPLAAAPARRGVLPRVLRAVPPAGRAARPLDARAWPRSSAGWRTSGSAPLESILRIARDPRASPRRSGRRSSRPRCWPCAAGAGWSGRSSSAATGRSTRCPAGSLVEFLAIRLMLDRFALAYTARDGAGLSTGRSSELRDAAPGADRRRTGRRASSSGPSWSSSSRRSLGLSPDVLHRLEPAGVGDARRGDRDVLRARAAADLPPGLRAAVLHPDARRDRPARPAAGRPARARRGSRRSSASTSARSRSAATWRSWPPTSRRSARPGSSAWPCTTAGRPTPTSSRSARS